MTIVDVKADAAENRAPKLVVLQKLAAVVRCNRLEHIAKELLSHATLQLIELLADCCGFAIRELENHLAARHAFGPG